MGQSINRRAALLGAAVSTVALAIPAAAAKPTFDVAHFMATATDEALVQFHAKQLAKLLCHAKPGLWRFSLEHLKGRDPFVLFHKDPVAGPDVKGFAQDF